VTQPPVDLVTVSSVRLPPESAAAAHKAGNTRVLAIAISVTVAFVILLVIIVSAQFNLDL